MNGHPSPALLELIADRFKVLSEPARLSILHHLIGAERTVSELVERTGLGQANVSKHLSLLATHDFVRRRRDGAYVRYSLSNRDVARLCDIMCKGMDAAVTLRAEALANGAARRPAKRRTA